MSTTVTAVASADAVGETAWAGLTGTASLYLSHASFRMAEEIPGYVPEHLVAREGDRVVGVLPTWLHDGSGNPLYDLGTVHDGAATERWRPTLLVGSRSGFVNELLLDRALDVPGRRRVGRALAGAARELAARRGARAVAAMYVREPALAELVAAFGAEATPLWTTAAYRYEVEWADLDGYLAGLRRSRRATVRAEMRAYAASGLMTAAEPMAGVLDEAVPLFVENLSRHGDTPDPGRLRDQLRAFAGRLGERTQILCCRRDGELVACLHVTEWEGVLYGQEFGARYDRTGAHAEYFALVGHQAIALALGRGLRAVDLSIDGHRAKLLRGARVEPRWTVVAPVAGDRLSDAGALRRTSTGFHDAYRAETDDLRPVRSGAPDAATLVWPAMGQSTLEHHRLPAPGPGEVTVDVVCSAISPGTERAQWRDLPNAQVGRPHSPGYAAAGVVIALGPGVTERRVGDRVAVKAPHGSRVNAPLDATFPLPDGLPFSAAATATIGVIASLGLIRGRLQDGEPVAVVGAGLIGLLVQRLAAARGSRVAVVARSAAKAEPVRAGGSELLVPGRDDAAVDAIGAPLVLDTTGDPAGLDVAVRAAAPGGRLVILGSPRGAARPAPSGLHERGLRLVGAHVDNLAAGERARVAEEYLRALATGTVRVDDLHSATVDAHASEAFYTRLAEAPDVLLATFDWATTRCAPGT